MFAPRRPWPAFLPAAVGALAAAAGLAAATLLIAAGGVPLAGPPAGSPAATAARVDAIFAPWAAPDGPGCAVSAMEGGDIVFSRGYGAANLEYDIPITPASVFHVASVSKQFTALAVALLADEGRLSWDDDIRRHVPELPDYGAPITLRHLAQHTSGVRDQWSLLQMAGWRWGGDVVTQDDVIDLLSRQAALHFRPGTEHLYSNSGYTLLAVVVERVSGQSLRAFTRARVFEPLGMARTTFRDDHTLLVRDRAYAYEADGAGGYRLSIPDFAVAGASSLFTTVEDLARWNRNFRTGEVGGQHVVRQLQEVTTLAGGAQVSYAFGLVHGTHRGRRTVGHGGTDAGYRSEFLRFPVEDVAVAVLCNVRTTDPARLARDVADAVLPALLAARADRPERGDATAGNPRERPAAPAEVARERSTPRRGVATAARPRPAAAADADAHADAAASPNAVASPNAAASPRAAATANATARPRAVASANATASPPATATANATPRPRAAATANAMARPRAATASTNAAASTNTDATTNADATANADVTARPNAAANAETATGPTPATPSPADLAALAGFYTHPESDIPLHLVLRGSHLVLLAGGGGQRLLPLGGLRFRLAGTTTEVELSPSRTGRGLGGGGPRGGGRTERGPTLRLGGWEPREYDRAAPVRPSAERLAEYAGAYHSADLDVVYRLRAEDRRLILRHRKLGDVRLTPTFDDGFYGGGWYLTFDRARDGRVRGFTMSSPRARKVRFRSQPSAAPRERPAEPWPGACSEPAPPVRCTSDRRSPP